MTKFQDEWYTLLSFFQTAWYISQNRKMRHLLKISFYRFRYITRKREKQQNCNFWWKRWLQIWGDNFLRSYFYDYQKQFIIIMFYRLHVISYYAISTTASSTVHTFNRSHVQPLASSTARKLNCRKFDLFK